MPINFNILIESTLRYQKIECFLVSGWWGAGKSYSIKKVKEAFGKIVDVFDVAELVNHEVDSQANNSKYCYGNNNYLFNQALTQKLTRFYRAKELFCYYRTLEELSRNPILNWIHTLHENKIKFILIEVPPLFLIWWDFYRDAYWVDADEMTRLIRISSSIPQDINEIALYFQLQYETLQFESNSFKRIVEVKDWSTMIRNLIQNFRN